MSLIKWYFKNSPKVLRCVVALFCVMVSAVHSVSAAVQLDDSQLVAASPALAMSAPADRTFVVTTAGQYSVTLTDIGFPARLTSANLVITNGSLSIASVNLPQAGTATFTAAPGTYTVHVLGVGSSAGTLGVIVAPAAGGTALLDYQTGIAASSSLSPANQTSISTSFTTAAAGNYQITLTDNAFPAALASFNLIVLDASGTPVARLCSPAIVNVCSADSLAFNANAASYDLFITATAAQPANAGLFGVQISSVQNSGGPASAVVYAATQPVGTLTKQADVQLPATGQYSIGLSDLRFTAALTQVRAAIVQGSNVVASETGSGVATFSANNGPATLYTYATADSSTNAGAFAVQIEETSLADVYGTAFPGTSGSASAQEFITQIANGTQTLLANIYTITAPTATTQRAYVFTTTIPSSGQYSFQVSDLNFPAAFVSLQAMVVQNGVSLGTLAVPGAVVAQADAAPAYIVVLASPASSTGMGLLGIGVDASPPSAVHVFDATQAVGDFFNTRTVSVSAAGSLDVTLNDLNFPTAFGSLALAITRGTSVVRQIIGGGKVSFDAVPGNYSLNFIARDAAAANYGLYGIKVEDSPPPVINLTANPTTVVAGGKTTLTWTSTGANSCVASGDWSGSQPAAGTETDVGPFSTDSTLTLTCTGAGGTNSAAVKITVNSASGSATSGGGTMSGWFLLALTLVALNHHFFFVRRIRYP